MSTTTPNYNLIKNEGTDDTLVATVNNQITTMNIIDDTMKANENKGNQALTPIEPISVVSQLITINTPDSTSAKFILDIQTTITGGAITINRDGGGAKPLQNPDGSNVEELSQDTRFFDVYEDISAFTLAPKDGASIKSIQVITTTLSKSSTSIQNVTIPSAVDADSTVVYIQPREAGAPTEIAFIPETLSSTTVGCRGTSGGSGSVNVRLLVIEYNNVKSKQTVLDTPTTADQDVSIGSPIDVNKTIVVGHLRSDYGNFLTIGVWPYMLNSTTIRYFTWVAGSTNQAHFQVLEFR